MFKECEDQIDIYDFSLHEISLEMLKHLLALVSSCKACDGCQGDIRQLERHIAEREKKIEIAS